MNTFRIILLATALLLLGVSALHAAPAAQTPQSSKSVPAPPNTGAAQLSPQQSNTIKPGEYTAKKGFLPNIKIIWPASGENWKAGAKQSVMWQAEGNLGKTVKITLRSGTGPEYVLASNAYIYANVPIPMFGSVVVDIPGHAAMGNNYRIVVTSNEYPSIKGTSNPFTVKPNITPALP